MHGVKHLANLFGFDFEALEFTIDTFTWSNPLKKSYVHNRIAADRRIVKKKIAMPRNGDVLRCIETFENVRLAEYHEKLYDKAIASPRQELSHIFAGALLQSLERGNVPERVWIIKGRRSEPAVWNEERKKYVLMKTGQEMEVEEVMDYAERGRARPDASWYFERIYLFLPGILCENLAFFVTPWENDDEKIKSIAKRSYEAVKRAAGVYPLTVPFFDSNLDERAKTKLGKYPGYTLVEESVSVANDCSGNFYRESERIYRKIYEDVCR